MVILFGVWFSQAAADTARESPDPELRNLLIAAIEETESFNDRFEAEVWLLDMSRRLEKKMPNDDTRFEFLKMLHHEASRVDLPPELVLAVIEVESNFDRFAISQAGARGLMQVMPFWLDEIGHPQDDLFQTRTNLRMGCTILRYYIDKENGDMRKGLARYNGSAGKRKYPDKVFNALSQRWYRQ
ncbi:MAG: lytic transglycosylase domain-containing protein [Gammaproteobacteria bacterium]|nr:lytic transglycosylase domain-containing protein [Gammaproteobacteria bacterium]